MATESATRAERPTYGNFTSPRRAGLFGIPLFGLLLLVPVGAIGFLLLVRGAWPLALAWTAACVGLLLPLRSRNAHDRNWYQVAAARLMHRRAERAGTTTYRSGPAGHTPDGRCRLPGLLAASDLTEEVDAYGQPFGLLHVPATHHYSVVFVAQPSDDRLVDADTVDGMVANWGGWLTELSKLADVEGASVTVETAPDTGVRLRRNLASQLVEDAPDFSVAVTAEMADQWPSVGARVRTWISITWSALESWEGEERLRTPWSRLPWSTASRSSKPTPRPRHEMAVEIGNLLPGLQAGLRGTGAGTTVHPASAQDLVDTTRVAYDPRVALAVDEARAGEGTGLTWDQAGPVAADEGFDRYSHDYAHSASWYMSIASEGTFEYDVLRGLLAPHRDIDRKRITIVYRPESPIAAAAIVDQQVRDADTTAGQRRRVQARDTRRQQVALRAAGEEAAGAALVRFGVILTATVLDPDALPRAQSTLRSLAVGPRLQIRPALGSQAAAFAAGLPLGLVLPKHLRLSTDIRERIS